LNSGLRLERVLDTKEDGNPAPPSNTREKKGGEVPVLAMDKEHTTMAFFFEGHAMDNEGGGGISQRPKIAVGNGNERQKKIESLELSPLVK